MHFSFSSISKSTKKFRFLFMFFIFLYNVSINGDYAIPLVMRHYLIKRFTYNFTLKNLLFYFYDDLRFLMFHFCFREIIFLSRTATTSEASIELNTVNVDAKLKTFSSRNSVHGNTELLYCFGENIEIKTISCT